MKELSIEEKAKAYDEALTLMQDCIPDEDGLVHVRPEEIFPELKESDDEVVGNAIAKCLACGVQHHIIDSDMNVRCLAWLEQGEQKLAETAKWSPQEESCICQLESLVKKQWGQSEIVHNSEKIKKMSELMFFLKTLNPNKKPANKVEPKFKIGDWVVYDGWVCQIIDVTEDGYCNSEHGFIPQGREDSMRLWTIEDAKDGDALVASDGSIFLFAGVVDCACKYYAALTPDNYFKVNKEAKGGYWETSRAVHPATKAQRDTLEKAMTDAGYTFDFEKKELKKIIVPIFNIGDTIAKKHNSDIHDFGSFVITDITGGKYWYNDRIICDITEQDKWELYEPVRQNSTAWSEEDEKLLKLSVENLTEFKDRYCIAWLESLKDRVQPQPKQEWSEEDESNLNSAIYYIRREPYRENDVEPIVDWLRNKLKFLRPQSTWKPSDEQVMVLAKASETYCGIDKGVLYSLYNDLKKLK